MTVRHPDDIEFLQMPGRTSGDPLRGLDAQSSLRLARPERTAARFAHRHPHSEEVIYVREGSGAVYVDGELFHVGPGDIVHVPAGAAHATIPNEGAAMELVCFFPHPSLQDNLLETDIDVMKEVGQ